MIVAQKMPVQKKEFFFIVPYSLETLSASREGVSRHERVHNDPYSTTDTRGIALFIVPDKATGGYAAVEGNEVRPYHGPPPPVAEPTVVVNTFADPVKFVELFWPHYTLYDKQKEIMYSVRDNYETIVPAANELGKDFVAALVALWFFTSRRPAKVVTTSAQSGQLEVVLWGEIRRFLSESKIPLPLDYTHMHIYQKYDNGKRLPNSDMIGRVVQKGEAMLGLHIPRSEKGEPATLLIVDEASGVDDDVYERSDTWAHRKLVISNCYPCSNFFFRGVKEGPLETVRPRFEKLYRKVIRIKALDSPNIRLALAEKEAGKEPSHRELVPGVVSYADYLQRRQSWDEMRQCIGLDAEFYEGASLKMFPPEWLDLAEQLHDQLLEEREVDQQDRIAEAIGVDPAEGGDNTCWSAVDKYGLIEIMSEKTPDTSVVTTKTIEFMKRHGLDPEVEDDCQRVVFDRGGGGKQHADRLRDMGYPVRTVGFGEAPSDDPKHGRTLLPERKEDKERRYAYRNKRSEMYGRLRLRMDPSVPGTQFAIPRGRGGARCVYSQLRNQLAPIPVMYDPEGRLMLPPKGAGMVGVNQGRKTRRVTLIDIIGHSPDEADSVCLAVYGMETAPQGVIPLAF